ASVAAARREDQVRKAVRIGVTFEKKPGGMLLSSRRQRPCPEGSVLRPPPARDLPCEPTRSPTSSERTSTMDHPHTIHVLNTLIATCNDGEMGFRKIAEHLQSTDLKILLEARATECRQACAKLRTHVVSLGGDPETGGSASGALHRGWVSVLGTL